MPFQRKKRRMVWMGNHRQQNRGEDIKNIAILLFFLFSAVSVVKNYPSLGDNAVGMVSGLGIDGKQIVLVDKCQTLYNSNTQYKITPNLS